MRFRRTHWLTALVIVGVIAYACITLMNMRTKIANANETQAELQQQVEKIQEENAALEYALEHQDDPSTIEDIARDKLLNMKNGHFGKTEMTISNFPRE